MIECLIAIGAFLMGLALLFVLSGAETATIAVNRGRFREAETSGDRDAAKVIDLLGNLRRILNGTLAAKTLAFVLAVLGFRRVLSVFGPEWDVRALAGFRFSIADALTVVVVPLLMLGLNEVLARSLFRSRADAVIHPLVQPLRILAALLAPVVDAIHALVRWGLRPFGGAAAGHWYRPDDLARLFGAAPALPSSSDDESEGSAVLDTAGRPMVRNIVDLERTRVREIMRPLIDVVAIRLGETGIEGVKELARRTGYSKFPVYRDRIIHLSGYVNVYDVLKVEDSSHHALGDYIRQACYVPEIMRVNELLQQFLEERLTAAIVVDEHGACAGWITREDLLEEIVGDIEDEFDHPPPPELVPEGKGRWVCEGQIDIDDLNEKLSTRFPKDGFETLAGWIYDSLGRVPKEGDSAPFEDFVVSVEEMEGPAIKKARIRSTIE